MRQTSKDGEGCAQLWVQLEAAWRHVARASIAGRTSSSRGFFLWPASSLPRLRRSFSLRSWALDGAAAVELPATGLSEPLGDGAAAEASPPPIAELVLELDAGVGAGEQGMQPLHQPPYLEA
jgi:hypothetical protein